MRSLGMRELLRPKGGQRVSEGKMDETTQQRICKTLAEMVADRAAHDPRFAKADTGALLRTRSPDDKTPRKTTWFVDLAPAPVRIAFLGTSKFGADAKATLPEGEDAKAVHVIFVVTFADRGMVPVDLGVSHEVFEARELIFNVTSHQLVPKHEVIGAQEEEALLARLRLKNKAHLPHILVTDPVARYLGMKRGQIAKITRPSPTAGEYIMYRCCC